MYEFRRSPTLYTPADVRGDASLPSFVCIGAPKCATTWLFDCLLPHPDVFLPDFKEINFFMVSRWGNDYERRGLSHYLSLFDGAGPGKIVGDFSPDILQDPYAPERVKALLPGARLIVMIRNPIKRSHSHYHYVRNRTNYDEYSLLDMLEDPRRDPAGILSQGLYAQQLEWWLEHFDQEQLLVISTEEVRTVPERLFSEVCAFVGADTSFVPSSLREVANPARQMRMPAVYRWKLRANRFLLTHGLDGVRNRLKRTGAARLIQRLNETPVENPPLGAEEAAALTAFYRDDIGRLSELLGRDYSGWLEAGA